MKRQLNLLKGIVAGMLYFESVKVGLQYVVRPCVALCRLCIDACHNALER